MKFGKHLHYERVASGPLADALPWIDYGCVSAPSSDVFIPMSLYSFFERPELNGIAGVARLGPRLFALGSRRSYPSGAVADAPRRDARSRTVF